MRRTSVHGCPTFFSIYIRKLLDNLSASPSLCVCVCVSLCVCVREGERRFAELTTSTTIMLCAAAAAVCLLAVLSPGPSLSAQDTPERSPCGDSFYRGTPPAGGPSSPPPPRPLCHSLPGGRTFATASSPTCDTAVYSAFHLGPGRTEEGGREEGEPVVRLDCSAIVWE